ncbi:MAG: alcohol dehydrogenase catalytic domain-containing protein [Myxococcales bacterium]|nr:alcohol dehydrogenase catalytic domain-containing protein [Myxococcales bacterium]
MARLSEVWPPGVILGHEVAGTVVETGRSVRSFQVGNRVVAILTNACGQCDRCRESREHRCRGEPRRGRSAPRRIVEHL